MVWDNLEPTTPTPASGALFETCKLLLQEIKKNILWPSGQTGAGIPRGAQGRDSERARDGRGLLLRVARRWPSSHWTRPT